MASRVRHCEQELVILGAPWTAWQPLTDPSQAAESLVVAAGPNGRLHAFTLGDHGQISHSEQASTTLSSPWTRWQPLSEDGDNAKSLLVTPGLDGRLHAFRIGLDDQVGHNEQVATVLNAPWTGWHSLSPASNDAKLLVVLANQNGQLHTFRIGLDGAVGHNEQLATQLNAPWSGWRTITAPGDLAVDLAVVASQAGRLHAFVLE